MQELSCNILWAWEPPIRALFRRLDPALWKESGYNPVVMLGRISQATLERMAADPRYVAQYQLACQRFDAHMKYPPTSADGKFEVLFRFYGPEKALFDKSWTMPDIETVKQ